MMNKYPQEKVGSDMKNNNKTKRFFAVVLMAMMVFALLPAGCGDSFTTSAASITASGKISESEVNLRSSASTSSAVVTTLKKNATLTIQKEVFTGNSTAASKRWYYVTAGDKTGYVRADLVGSISYGNTGAVTTDELNYREGPATSFKRLGTVFPGTGITLLLPASREGSSEVWYKVNVYGQTAYVSGDYVNIGGQPTIPQVDLTGKSDLAVALLTNPTQGGRARVVYTFNTSNCKKLFSIKGYKKAKVPQGMTFTGSEYYILYGMSAGQSIVTYSASGRRLSASKFSFSIGHPNGITWDPVTRMCYIFKGNTKKFFTWNPATGRYGKSKVPYSSSGIAYDNATNTLYATSKTGIRAYSADGNFTHQRLFSRCNHGIFHYIQDCGAAEGFIFHGISGSNKKKTNYLDIYRAADGAYLGSIKITIGEIESAVVGNDGFLQLLINTSGEKDYVWKTPLNINELKN